MAKDPSEETGFTEEEKTETGRQEAPKSGMNEEKGREAGPGQGNGMPFGGAKDPGPMPEPDAYAPQTLWERFRSFVNRVVDRVVEVTGNLAHTFVFGRTETAPNYSRDLQNWMRAREKYDKETKNESSNKSSDNKQPGDKENEERKNAEKEKNGEGQQFDLKKYMEENGYQVTIAREGSKEEGKETPDIYTVSHTNAVGNKTTKVMDAETFRSLKDEKDFKDKFRTADYRINPASQLAKNYFVKVMDDKVRLTPAFHNKENGQKEKIPGREPIYADKDILDSLTRHELKHKINSAIHTQESEKEDRATLENGEEERAQEEIIRHEGDPKPGQGDMPEPEMEQDVGQPAAEVPAEESTGQQIYPINMGEWSTEAKFDEGEKEAADEAQENVFPDNDIEQSEIDEYIEETLAQSIQDLQVEEAGFQDEQGIEEEELQEDELDEYEQDEGGEEEDVQEEESEPLTYNMFSNFNFGGFELSQDEPEEPSL